MAEALLFEESGGSASISIPRVLLEPGSSALVCAARCATVGSPFRRRQSQVTPPESALALTDGQAPAACRARPPRAAIRESSSRGTRPCHRTASPSCNSTTRQREDSGARSQPTYARASQPASLPWSRNQSLAAWITGSARNQGSSSKLSSWRVPPEESGKRRVMLTTALPPSYRDLLADAGRGCTAMRSKLFSASSPKLCSSRTTTKSPKPPSSVLGAASSA